MLESIGRIVVKAPGIAELDISRQDVEFGVCPLISDAEVVVAEEGFEVTGTLLNVEGNNFIVFVARYEQCGTLSRWKAFDGLAIDGVPSDKDFEGGIG